MDLPARGAAPRSRVLRSVIPGWLGAAMVAGAVACASPAVALAAPDSAQGTQDAATAGACAPQWQLSTDAAGDTLYNGIWCGAWTVPADSTNPFSADFGQCTYWAAEMRPDIWDNATPSEQGGDWDAGTWAAHATQEGYDVSSTPAPGDIAVWSPSQAGNPSGPGHVAFVQSVTGSTIVVTEMNARFGTSGGDTTLLTDTPVGSGYGWQGLQFIPEPSGAGYTPPASPSLSLSVGTPTSWVNGTTATVQLPIIPGAGNASVIAVEQPSAATPTTSTGATTITSAGAKRTNHRRRPIRRRRRPARHAARHVRHVRHARHARARGRVRHVTAAGPRALRAVSTAPASGRPIRVTRAVASPHALSAAAPVAFTQQTAAPWEQFTGSLAPGTWTVTVSYQSAGAPFTAPADQTFSITIP